MNRVIMSGVDVHDHEVRVFQESATSGHGKERRRRDDGVRHKTTKPQARQCIGREREREEARGAATAATVCFENPKNQSQQQQPASTHEQQSTAAAGGDGGGVLV